MAYLNNQEPIFTLHHSGGIKVYLVSQISAYGTENKNVLYAEFNDDYLTGDKDPRAYLADILIEMAESIRCYRPRPRDEYSEKRLKCIERE